jgi:hypothetical protein
MSFMFNVSHTNFRPVTLDVISRPQLLIALRNAGVIHVLRKSGHCDHIADPDGQVRTKNLHICVIFRTTAL